MPKFSPFSNLVCSIIVLILFQGVTLAQINRAKTLRSEINRDTNLELAIRQTVAKDTPSGLSAYYTYNRVDLNGDGKPESLVYISGKTLCGTGGCHTAVFRSIGKNYELVADIGITTTPITVSTSKTNGWKDLIVGVFGGGIGNSAGFYSCKFNGNSYPENPSDGVKIHKKAIILGQKYFDKNPQGIEIKF